jgi:hypothetical protein
MLCVRNARPVTVVIEEKGPACVLPCTSAIFRCTTTAKRCVRQRAAFPWKKSTRKKVKRRLAAPFVFQASLSADVIGIRAARNAGNTPPATPISTASTIPTTSAVPLIRKANPISAKFVPMAAAVMPSAGRASRQPNAPPTMARAVDHERRQDADLGESERPQRADFTGACRDECVHRVDRAEHRTDAHDAGHEHRQSEELPCDDTGLGQRQPEIDADRMPGDDARWHRGIL